MSKAVLMSIKPEYCELILKGKKTIEVRKNRPKLEPSFRCYIYCTKPKTVFDYLWSGTDFDRIGVQAAAANGKVIGEFVCDTYVIDKTFGHDDLFNGAACLSKKEASAYSNGEILFGWHVSDPKMYDKPKDLSEFSRYGCKIIGDCCINSRCKNYIGNGYYDPPECAIEGCSIIRAPQSWCYVEEI